MGPNIVLRYWVFCVQSFRSRFAFFTRNRIPPGPFFFGRDVHRSGFSFVSLCVLRGLDQGSLQAGGSEFILKTFLFIYVHVSFSRLSHDSCHFTKLRNMPVPPNLTGIRRAFFFRLLQIRPEAKCTIRNGALGLPWSGITMELCA